MTDYSDVRKFLSESFQDYRLSKKEKSDLRLYLEALDDKQEMLSYTRNSAFNIFREMPKVDDETLNDSVTWLERVIKTIDNVRTGETIRSPGAFFSPGDSCARQIINALLTARSSIDICVFTISDNSINDAILKAHALGRQVRVISDNDKANDAGSDVYYLAKKGVSIRLDQSPFHMHHKFAIFDQKTLLNGSFNWTRSASEKNEENITLLYDPQLIQAFSNTFEVLWKKANKMET